MEIIVENGIELRHGDILFVRVGFTAQYSLLSTEKQRDFPDRQPGGLLGVEATKETMRWMWDNRFAAIASDAMGFERGPATGPYNDPDVSIHQWALAGWGMPIGEMFDLEVLAEKCAERKRWTFFLCSVPLKVSLVSPCRQDVVNCSQPIDSRRCGEPWQCCCHTIVDRTITL